jgi:hypothetical protein
MQDCIASGNSGDGISFLNTTGSNINPSFIDNSTFHANNNGIKVSTTSGIQRLTVLNSIFSANTTYDINCATASVNGQIMLNRNAYYTTGTGARNNIAAGFNDIALSASPFTNAASRDFSLNNTASAGAACRGVGYPSKIGIADDTTTNYLDLGAAQVQLPTSSGVSNPGIKTGGRL